MPPIVEKGQLISSLPASGCHDPFPTGHLGQGLFLLFYWYCSSTASEITAKLTLLRSDLHYPGLLLLSISPFLQPSMENFTPGPIPARKKP
jgi:hypothetical protein